MSQRASFRSQVLIAAAVAAATGSDVVGGATASPASVRLILPKNRLSIQRRATVTGASPTSSRPALNIEQVIFFFKII